jgi:hypothetical protein
LVSYPVRLWGGSRSSRCGVTGVAPNAPEADADPGSDAGEGDEAMTINNINSHKS